MYNNFTHNVKHKPVECCLIVSFILFLLGCILSVAIIHGERNHYLPEDEKCPVFSRPASFSAEKQVFDRWNWRYKVRNNDITARSDLYCPTIQKDSNIFMDGKFVGRSDGKILTTVSKTYIRDCHGKKIFVIRTGNTFETIINMNKILVSFELRKYNKNKDGKENEGNEENEVIAYSEQFNFFTNDISILDKNQNVIARLYMNKYQFQAWTWEYTIYNASHPASDPLILLIISTKSSFSETTKDDDGNDTYATDICNSYFWSISLILIIIAGLIVIGLLAMLCFMIKQQEGFNFNFGMRSINNYDSI